MNKFAELLGLRTSPRIFFGAAAIVILFVVGTLVFTDAVGRGTEAASTWLMDNMGWFYVLGVTSFLVFLIYIAMSRFGRIKLGPDDEPAEHSGRSWFAMLFAAGIGTILMFWGVAEPVSHFGDPPRQGVEPGSVQAAEEALAFTFYHFTYHTWAIFALPGLAFCYFLYKRNLPPRVSSILQPILGERIHGRIGQAVDVLAIVGTVFGLAVSVGLGTLQINGGLNQLFGIPESDLTLIIVIVVVSLIALVSLAAGLEKGIKRLSNINIVAAIGLMLFVFVTGATVFMTKGTIEAFGSYLAMLPELALWNDTFGDTGWQSSWTVFYWAWTITWAPFVGLFIARISRGRTVREFVLGVLAIPATFSVIWFGIFGSGSIDIEMNGDGGLVDRVVGDGDIPGALFAFLENFPFAMVTSAISIVLVVIFFTTSVDSAALITDTMANGHEEDAPLRQRVFWGISIAMIAVILLTVTAGGAGLEALETTTIVVGFPFFILALFQMYSVYRAMREDAGELPPMRTRSWRQVLPPEEHERRREAGELEGEVIEPQALTSVPRMREPYEPLRPVAAGPLARRTGSAPLASSLGPAARELAAEQARRAGATAPDGAAGATGTNRSGGGGMAPDADPEARGR
ncbi:BCCT family transporter [Pseudactinotalea sp. Z1732]|uniref:BCCT family transporter n=1 Tax=Micrococcales TaxID=85006 RepID=UPI003C7EA63A